MTRLHGDQNATLHQQAIGQAQQIEQLEGGQGRSVFFRPQRYSSDDLAAVEPIVELTTAAGQRFAPTLRDVSQNGLAFLAPPGIQLEIDATLPLLVVSFDGYEAYRGTARVASLRHQQDDTIVGAEFLDSLMDIEDVLYLRRLRLQPGAGGAGLQLADRPWRVDGNQDFKSLTAELRLFLEDASQQLTELERVLPWHVIHTESESAARAGLIARIETEFVKEVVSYSNKIDAALRTASPREWQILKEFSLRHLHQFLMQAPCLQRAFYKPLGYPGDFEFMRFVYERNFDGATLFARAINLAFLRSPAGLALRARKDLIRDRLLEHTRARRSAPLRILSVAAGPAQECFELLDKLEPDSAPVEIVLFDQDRQALSYAFSRLQRRIDDKSRLRLRFVYLHESIKRLLADSHLFDEFGPFDVVICAGLFDYLRPATARSLCRSLYQILAPGGTLYVGNMVPDNPSRWTMEHHLDWFLIYRTRDELLEVARQAARDAEVCLLEEVTGVNPFARITRPA